MTNLFKVRTDCEQPKGESITQTCEKLDPAQLLQRAALGVVDLTDLSRRVTYDGEFDDPRQAISLLSRPDSLFENEFGASHEDAREEYSRHADVVSRESKRAAETKAGRFKKAASEQDAARNTESDAGANE